MKRKNPSATRGNVRMVVHMRLCEDGDYRPCPVFQQIDQKQFWTEKDIIDAMELLKLKGELFRQFLN